MAPDMMAARTTQPAAALAAQPLIHLTQSVRELTLPVAPPEGGILILQRPRIRDPQRMLSLAASIHARGWMMVIEYDDDPSLVARILGDASPDIYYRSIQMAHAVQTSTERLAGMFRQHNPEVATFRNAVLSLGPPRPPAGTGPVRVFYGALNRGDFAVQVAASLGPVVAAHPEVEFVIAHDRAFFEALPTTRKRFAGSLGYPDYLAALHESDIVLMPLEGRPEELSKSDLKWVEASAQGCVSVVSPPVYAATVQHGENGLIAPRLQDWAPLLDQLVGDPALRLRLVQAARGQVAASRLFAHQTAARESWYRDLLARRDQLGQAVHDRSPALSQAIAALRQPAPPA